jgi:hypothetical protein
MNDGSEYQSQYLPAVRLRYCLGNVIVKVPAAVRLEMPDGHDGGGLLWDGVTISPVRITEPTMSRRRETTCLV